VTHRVTLIPGDGTGPEIMAAARRALDATGVSIEWEVQTAGTCTLEHEGTPLPQRVLESIKRNRVALKGPITTPVGRGFPSVNVALRTELDLYANLRPCKTYRGVRTRHDNIDLVVIRENTEDLYVGVEPAYDDPRIACFLEAVAETGAGPLAPRSSVCVKAISVNGSRRIVQFALEYARANRRRRVTIVHKANI
jgi:isocitrate dehydrogenase (NAD+)